MTTWLILLVVAVYLTLNMQILHTFRLKLIVVMFFCFFFLHPQEAETGFVPSVQDFDKKLAEADAYLQILIDQLKVGLNGATPNRHHHFIWNIVFIFTCLSH